TVPVQETLEDALDGRTEPVVIGSLRRGEGGTARFLTSLAEAYVHGVTVDWTTVLAGRDAHRIDLPTYAFQHERFWPEPGTGGDVTGVGLDAPGHPFLGAVVRLAESEALVLTGRLSLRTHPWLSDHQVVGTVPLPGTAFVELAMLAGDQVGCDRLEELTMEAPLLLPPSGHVRLQLTVGSPDEAGHRTIQLYSQREDAEEDAGWLCHGSGLLAAGGHSPSPDLSEWPPPGAEPVPVDDLYELAADGPVLYGPAFQGLRAAWRRGPEVFAEVTLPTGQLERASSFTLHPVLLDAALHTVGLGGLLDDSVPGWRPFAWSGVSVHAAGASTLRVRLAPAGANSLTLFATDTAGVPVVSVDSLAMRPIAAEQFTAGARQESLLRMDWAAASTESATGPRWAVLGPVGPDLLELAHERSEGGPVAFADLDALVASLAEGAAAPDFVLLDPAVDGPVGITGLAEATRLATGRVLDAARAWLDPALDERLSSARLVVVTRRALAARDGEDVTGLAGAPLWGLVRSAQAENPGRLVLLDVDGDAASWQALPAALASGENQLALRAGTALTPRLGRIRALTPVAEPDACEVPAPTRLDPEGTVLVTGATSGLGAMVARRLVSEHGVRRLLLLSRRGPAAEGAAELVDALREAGADAAVVACDVADRESLALALAGVPAGHPLTAVVHCAGTVDNGLLASLTPEKIDEVFRPKVDAAVNLHALTEGIELAAFVLFSSVAGTIGGTGQGNYAAANTFLDALAQHRRAGGLAATSLAWGLWETNSGMGGRFDAALLANTSMRAVVPLPSEEGLGLFDACWRSDEPVLFPVKLNAAALRAQAGDGALPPVLRALAPGGSRRTAAGSGQDNGAQLRGQLAAMSAGKRYDTLLALIRRQVASVLGHASAEAIETDRPFKELGFDSLTAVELRNRLNAATGVRLPVTAVFDYPTMEVLAGFLRDELFPAAAEEAADPQAAEEARVREALLSLPLARLRESGLLDPLLELAEGRSGAGSGAEEEDRSDSILAMDATSLIQLALSNSGAGDLS
ncbi:type I polyketide synthase, partial [Kitasatospora sp. NPDC008050]|uniref:type I polyketide synthase n=1 Tax=Kitasatospora sp. NPDC008050 TaxID=3364021 RepID=UPI0036EF3929